MTAQYKALADTFISPYFVRKGSIFETEAPPGPHLVPVNAEARAAFERWYDEEIPEIDARTRLPVKASDGSIVMWKPHAKYRTAVYEPADAATVTLISEPSPSNADFLDLAQARFARAGNGELRPAADPVHAAGTTTEDGTTILVSAPKPAKGT